MDAALDLGINVFDTADAYGGGRSESAIGRWLPGKGSAVRDQVLLSSKAFNPVGDGPNDHGLSRRHLKRQVERSLQRLGASHLDLFLTHEPDADTPLDETLGALDDLVRVGKVRYVGCSNYLAYRLARAIGVSEAKGLARYDSVQPRYNLIFREFERELFPLCLEEGIGVIPYNPIAGGLLSGKHDRSKPPEEGTRFTLGTAGSMYQDRYWHDNVFDTVDQLGKLADEAGMPLPTLAVAWTLANPAITAPIVGASRPGQLDATVAALDTPLDADLLATLNELTAPYRRGDAPR
jgi:aryl-alcohol dehydrogenase (NADP+)